ncbi:MAG: DUF262 domain-containing protein [Hylemonella sp.]|uniref:DUF262 domain-containing protein n=1 Tax=Hylemonella sp. TaxID=2066020 RepID=UPI0022BEB5FE|nr:DUF262 domain-containing protein [Hylemonella sp.]MCZ8252175.1 DUF262 domain-containing protein [Hylemonella sp.]
MATIRTYPMTSSAILRLNFLKNRIQKDPTYQRNGDVWTLEKKQLLIDSILNDYDIPKLYFHVLTGSSSTSGERSFDYAIIDGRQRLEAIWGFMNDEWSLADDFEYLADPNVQAAGLRYSDLARKYPELKVFFDSFNLPITVVETDDLDLIEDMFSRLNEAVPLNAAEKRNSLGGPMVGTIRNVSEHDFFVRCIRLGNRRFQHREIAARLLFIEYAFIKYGRILDTKKPYLDSMVKSFRDDEEITMDSVTGPAIMTLDGLAGIFHTRDELLNTQATIPIFYLCAQSAIQAGSLNLLARERIIEFNKLLDENRVKAASDLAGANYRLLEYERMTQQGTNDSASIRERTAILCEFLGIQPSEKIANSERSH